MKENKFDRSSFMKKKHAEAKRQRELFSNKFKDEKKPAYFNFLKNDTPLENRIISYQVSYQVSYRGAVDSILVSPKTFTVFGFKGQEDEIKTRTMNMILDSKGKSTNNNFASGTLSAVKDSTELKILPRGLEQSSKKVSQSDLSNVVESGFVVKDLDTTLTFKNKKNREGKMNLDIRHFL